MKAWKKGAILGVLISFIPFILLFLIAAKYQPSGTQEGAMAGVGLIIGEILVVLFSLFVIPLTTLVGYSFDKKESRFRILGFLWGFLSVISTSAYIFIMGQNIRVNYLFQLTLGLPSCVPMKMFYPENNWTLLNILFFIVFPLVLGYAFGYIIDKKSRK